MRNEVRLDGGPARETALAIACALVTLGLLAATIWLIVGAYR